MHRGAEHAPPQLALPGLFLCHLTGCASEAYSAANCGSESKRDLLNRSKHCISRPVCHAGTSDRPIRSPTRDVSTTHAAPTSCDVSCHENTQIESASPHGSDATANSATPDTEQLAPAEVVARTAGHRETYAERYAVDSHHHFKRCLGSPSASVISTRARRSRSESQWSAAAGLLAKRRRQSERGAGEG
jgi:hypothetical protein